MGGKAKKGQAGAGEYYAEIERLPRITLRAFLPSIREAEKGATVFMRHPKGAVLVSSMLRKDGEEITLSLRLAGGEIQDIKILRESSNLVSGAFVYYFLCPYGYKCRKLFYIGGTFASRRAFAHRYNGQNDSRRWRAYSHVLRDEPYKAYGKEYYKGRLTPYGKRCERYEKGMVAGYLTLFPELRKPLRKQLEVEKKREKIE